MSDPQVRIELTGLAARIREAVEDSARPDATVIAHDVCSTLTPEEVEEALHRGVRLLVEREARYQRASALRQAREDAPQSTSRRSRRRNPPDKQAQARLSRMTADHQALVAERFFSVWKETPTGRKFLGECTAEDLRYSAERHRDRSGQALHHAACDEALARALGDGGAQTVRDLGYEAAISALQSVGV